MIASGKVNATVETIAHQSTPQKSIKVTILGSKKPNEIVVLGGHLDSINDRDGNAAPGADDNASGSANLLEALRVVLDHAQPERTVEFYWYAGEESGLLGSREIAEKAKSTNKNVIGVLQLDMTLFPGDGPMTITNIGDYTNAWLRDYVVAVNEAYINIKIVEGTCGYGCSDHASWHRQGFPAVFPFESRMNSSNPNIHSSRDILNNKLNFDHSLIFSKIALAFAMDLANSDLRQP
jgi:leucyl aminopeptidase